MGQEADQLKHDIEQRRQHMSQSVEAIEDRVTPGRVVGREKAKVRQRWTGVRDSVMGSRDYNDSDSGGLGGMAHSAQESAQGALSTVRDSPDALMGQTKGNPLVAGAIAFGIGALIGAVAPTTREEEQAVARLEPQLRDAAEEARHGAETAIGEVRTEAQDRAQELKGSAQDSVESVKGSAQESAGEVTEHAKDQAQTIRP